MGKTGAKKTVDKRASPIKHNVGGHFRGGKFIETYDRGSGERKKKAALRRKLRSMEKKAISKKIASKDGLFYRVSLSGQGKSETYNGVGSPVSSLRQVVNKLQRPIVPTRAVLRRVKT